MNAIFALPDWSALAELADDQVPLLGSALLIAAGDGVQYGIADMGVLDAQGSEIYRYMNFDQIADYKDVADTVTA